MTDHLPAWLRRTLASVAVLLAAALTPGVEAGELQPFDTTYTLSRGILTLGEARFRLQRTDTSGCWRYQYDARPSGLARLFIGNVTERSDFCVIDGQVQSRFFEFHRADKNEDNFTLHFNWAEKLVRSSSGEMRELDAGMVDRLAQQMQVQLWVMQRQGRPGDAEITSIKVEDDKIRTYRFRITGTESVEVPVGRYETVRVERVDDPDKSTRFWLLADRDYLVAQVDQIRKGSEQLKMQLKAINPVPEVVPLAEPPPS